MSYAVAASCCPDYGYCEAVMRGIDRVNGDNNPSFLSTPVGALQSLFDPVNTSRASYQPEIQRTNSGPVRKVRVVRQQRGTAQDAVAGIPCDTPLTMPLTEECIVITQSHSIGWTSTKEEMQQYCDEAFAVEQSGGAMMPPIFMRHLETLLANMNGLREIVDTNVIALLSANVGNNIRYDSNATQAYCFLQTVTGDKVEKGLQQVVYDMNVSQVYGQPLFVGLGVFDQFNTSKEAGCCNQSGLDWNAMGSKVNYKYYRDNLMNGVLGNENEFFVLAPGAVQFVYHNDFAMHKLRPDNRHGDSVYGVIADPFVPGLMYDFVVKEVNCQNGQLDQSWELRLYLHWDLAFIPAEAYKLGDVLRTANGHMNGVFKYEALTC